MRTYVLAALLAAGIAGPSNAVPIAFTSSGAFSSITSCTSSPGCAISSSGGGTNNVLNLSGSNNGTLTANNISFSGATNLNDTVIGSITWADRNASAFDTNFGVTYTLSINFTAPNATTVSEALTLTVAQAVGITPDQVSGLALSTLPGAISLAGVLVSDLHFSILTGSAGSISNGVWTVSPCGTGVNTACTQTSTLLLTADFTAAAASTVPEPASLALLGAGILGLGLTRRRG